MTPPHSIDTPVIPPIGHGPEPIVKVTPPIGWQPETEPDRTIAALMLDPGESGGGTRPPSNLPQEQAHVEEQIKVTVGDTQRVIEVEIARSLGMTVMELSEVQRRFAKAQAELLVGTFLLLVEHATPSMKVALLKGMSEALADPGRGLHHVTAMIDLMLQGSWREKYNPLVDAVDANAFGSPELTRLCRESNGLCSINYDFDLVAEPNPWAVGLVVGMPFVLVGGAVVVLAAPEIAAIGTGLSGSLATRASQWWQQAQRLGITAGHSGGELVRQVPRNNIGFRPGQWLSHFEKHGAEFGYRTAVEYLRGAQRLISGSPGIESFQRGRDMLFYNRATNEFAVLDSNGYIRTYFKPLEGLDYWLRITGGK